jgi:ribonucleoside-diphosphate reductase alpha chain
MNNYLPTDYQNFIALSRYARWKEDEQRRETWGETVERYFDYMKNICTSTCRYAMPEELTWRTRRGCTETKTSCLA